MFGYLDVLFLLLDLCGTRSSICASKDMKRVFIGSLCLLRNTRELNSMDLGFAFD